MADMVADMVADMAVDTGAVTGVVVDIMAMDGDILVMVMVMVMVMDTGVVATGVDIILIILITHIMDRLPMEKETPIIQEDMAPEIATTDHLLLEMIADTVPLQWEDQQRDLTTR